MPSSQRIYKSLILFPLKIYAMVSRLFATIGLKLEVTNQGLQSVFKYLKKLLSFEI